LAQVLGIGYCAKPDPDGDSATAGEAISYLMNKKIAFSNLSPAFILDWKV